MSESKVAQPPMSGDCATLPRMGHLLGDAPGLLHRPTPPAPDRRPPGRRLLPDLHRDGQRRPHRPPHPRPGPEISCAPATPWSSGNSTASAAPCGISSTPSPAWPTATLGSPASRRPSTPPPPAASWCSTSLPPWPLRTRPHPRTHHRRPGRRPSPGPPRRPTLGPDRPQAAGGAGAVRHRAVHAVLGGGDRHDPGRQPGLGLLPAGSRRRLTNSPLGLGGQLPHGATRQVGLWRSDPQ